MKTLKRFLGLSLFLFFFLTPFSQVFSQTASFQVTIDKILYNQFPLIETFVSVLDIQGFPIKNLTETDFALTEDGLPITSFMVEPYFNTEETLALVLVIDTSGSMKSSKKPSPMDNAVDAAGKFVDQLNPQDLVGVITFADSVQVLSELSQEKGALKGKLAALVPDGATAMNDAIVEAVNMLQNRSERRAIVLLTDGKPEGEQVFTYDQALAHASNRAIPIYPIGFGGVDKNQLKRLAEVTGGAEQIQPDSETLYEAMNTILSVFREKYRIEFNSNITPDEKEHELVVGATILGSPQNDQAKFTARKPVILSMLSPQSDEIVQNIVQISATVDSLNPIERVEFYIDEELVETLNSEPFLFEWDSTQEITGPHTIEVVASDQLGFTDSAKINVAIELQKNEWIFWLIGLIVLIGLAIFISLGLRRRKAPPSAARKAALVEIDGNQIGKSWPLDKEETSLGRKISDNDIGLKGTSASRNHAIIQRTRNGYIASCLKSANPLNVNGENCERATLKDGDILKLGESTFRFEYRQ